MATLMDAVVEIPATPAPCAAVRALTSIAGFGDRLRDAGALPVHVAQVLRGWVLGHDGAPGDIAATPGRAAATARGRNRRAELPRRVRDELPAFLAALDGLATVRAAHAGEGGAARLLVDLVDGHSVESVLLPPAGVCVSTQVGCAVGCLFCMSGKDGLVRGLGSAEIVAQVVAARRRQPVDKVVFMGIGEPAHNLDAVIEAIDFLGGAGGIAHKRLVFSTVGDRRVFARLPGERVKPALALSLHSTDPARRRELLPRAPSLDPAELVELGEAYARATGYPIQYQWTLLEGINDGDDELAGLVRLLKGKFAMMNFILYNPVAGSDFRRPDIERALAMSRHLHTHGIVAALRDSAGQDVDGGCGQLRARSAAVSNSDASEETKE